MPTDQQQSAASVTPGQKLLHNLHSTSASRLQRYHTTVAAQADKAKRSIPKPKHPASNDVGSTPADEVHQLPAEAPSTQVCVNSSVTSCWSSAAA